MNQRELIHLVEEVDIPSINVRVPSVYSKSIKQGQVVLLVNHNAPGSDLMGKIVKVILNDYLYIGIKPLITFNAIAIIGGMVDAKAYEIFEIKGEEG